MRSDFDVQVGNRLRMARFRAKLTPAELAKMVGSDEAEIESWETGSSVIYLNELVVLCKALNVTPHILLAGTTLSEIFRLRISAAAVTGLRFNAKRNRTF